MHLVSIITSAHQCTRFLFDPRGQQQQFRISSFGQSQHSPHEFSPKFSINHFPITKNKNYNNNSSNIITQPDNKKKKKKIKKKRKKEEKNISNQMDFNASVSITDTRKRL